MLLIDRETGVDFWVNSNHAMTIDEFLQHRGITVNNDDGQLIGCGDEVLNAWYENLITGGEFRQLVEDYIRSNPKYEGLIIDNDDPTFAVEGETEYLISIKDGEITIKEA